MTNSSLNGARRHFRVAIIGTGFSGLGMAIRMLGEGMNDFVVFEREDDVGGTWRENTYPGIACDVPSNLYSFSFAPNPNWSKVYSGGGEIWDYLRDTALKYGVMPNIRFGHEVTEGHWESDGQRWRLETTQGTFYADIVIGGMGPLAEPAIPAVKGIENFKGSVFHSAQWDHDFDLTGKRIAVVGTGASAIQFVPAVQRQAGKMYLFQRTAPWVLPRNERAFTRLEQRLYKRLPIVQRAVRAGIYWAFETRVIAFAKQPRFMKVLEAIGRTHLKRQVKDPQLRSKLTPRYTIGCKRILMANDYYPALQQPNVEVVTDGVDEVHAHSIVTQDGAEREVDAIIWGTGFHVTDTEAPSRVFGEGDRRLSEVWGTSPQAYLGTAIAGFPNIFMMIGPNTGLGHTSMVFMIESQIEYLIGALKHMEQSNVGALNVRQDELERFNAALQKRLKNTVWNTGGCASWYLDAEGRNTTIWPGFTFEFRQRTRHFDPAVFDSEPRRVARQAVPAG